MELAIDSVGLQSSVAVSDKGRVLVELTWPTGRRHTPTLMPMVDQACRLAAISPDGLKAVFVDIGPGAYGGIRAGMAAAEALAVTLGVPLLGVNRLEIEAYTHAAATAAIAALHAAGRGQWAWARYRGPAAAWREEAAPELRTPRELVEALEVLEPGVLCGETEELAEDVVAHLQRRGWIVGGAAASMRRAGLLAELGWRRWQAQGAPDAPPQPLYMREPAIGPQPPVQPDAPVLKEGR